MVRSGSGGLPWLSQSHDKTGTSPFQHLPGYKTANQVKLTGYNNKTASARVCSWRKFYIWNSCLLTCPVAVSLVHSLCTSSSSAKRMTMCLLKDENWSRHCWTFLYYDMGVPRQQPHCRSGLATLPSVGAIPRVTTRVFAVFCVYCLFIVCLIFLCTICTFSALILLVGSFDL